MCKAPLSERPPKKKCAKEPLFDEALLANIGFKSSDIFRWGSEAASGAEQARSIRIGQGWRTREGNKVDNQ